ncbi:MAG TPA: transporter substrate-binding domain-containing protein [Noviherbaspirillum sp.]|nr:transporter substrate-binding domain-containing protein [Noviherbaspirillum sp.]
MQARHALRLLLVATLSGVCAAALAGNNLEHARKRKQLVVGVHYVVPAYQGGMKFRTPEAIDTALAQDLAARLAQPLTTVQARGPVGKADVVLAALAHNDPLRDPLHRSATVIPTGHVAGPMAIMRTDTDIKTWQQLKGRKVCLAEGGRYAGTLAANYGAIEMVKKAPADALLALRTGECDAAVHDNTLLEELIQLPEWKKFSARLPVGPRTTLAFVVPHTQTGTAAYLRQVTRDWAAKAYAEQLTKKAVRHIAFEVYLDQDVPDCH